MTTSDAREGWTLNSRAVYIPPEEHSKSISYPIYTSANYQYDGDIYDQIVGGERSAVNIYSRCGNPTEYAFEEHVAQLEGATEVLAVASGMAAITHAVLSIAKAGGHVVVDRTTYSSTHEFFNHRIQDFGIETTFVDTANLDEVSAAIRPNTALVYTETIANPTMKLAPLRALSDLVHGHGLPVMCDNTFASPAVCRPHEHGVDVVVESATKFMGGHNDAVGGTISLRSDILDAGWVDWVRWNTLTKLGGALSPFNAWLLLRGLQTLPLRVERMTANAQRLAEHLEAHPQVRRVFYPGLESFPQRSLAAEQLDMPGAMLSFVLDSEAEAAATLKALKLGSFAASLGGVRTVTQVPGTMAFLDIPEHEREEMGIAAGMARVSVGIEDSRDIIADFDQALRVAAEAVRS